MTYATLVSHLPHAETIAIFTDIRMYLSYQYVVLPMPGKNPARPFSLSSGYTVKSLTEP
jgi:hypothetical protein